MVNKSPLKARGHYNLGVYLREIDLTDEAIEHLNTVLSLEPANAGSHYELGIIYMSEGEVEKARRHFEALLLIEPGHYWARKFLEEISGRPSDGPAL